jgi:hypothetical protein
VKLAPVPVAGVPPVAVHAKVYGDVPPVADAVKVTAVPTVPVVGPVTVTTTGNGLIVMVASLNALALLASVIVALIVLLPFTEYVTVKLDPVPVAGVPPGALQENV